MSDLRDIASAFEALGRWLKAIATHVSAQDGHLVQIRENIHHANNVMTPIAFQVDDLAKMAVTTQESLGRIERQLELLQDQMVAGFRMHRARLERVEDGKRIDQTR